jgi:putative hemolysin
VPNRQSSLPDHIEIPRESFENARSLILSAPLGPIAPVLEKWFIGDVEQIYSKLLRSSRTFFDAMLDSLNIRYRCAAEEIQHIPATGPAIIVANHPFGLLDGMVLGAILAGRRQDFRILTNALIASIPQLREFTIPVDPFGGHDAVRTNRKPLRESVQFLRAGGLLAVFPAGEVASLRPGRFGITDPDWTENVVRLAERVKAPVVPVFFHGTNSPAFHLAGLVHEKLRTLLLPHELLNKADSTVKVSIGTSISPERLASKDGVRSATAYLRARTYMLGSKAEAKAGFDLKLLPVRDLAKRPLTKGPVAIAEAQHASALRREIQALPAERKLVASGAYQVFVAQAEEIPAVVLELGRLREITFRKVGEGTGAARDLDRFDCHYEHLFAWNEETGELIGAYRIARSDEVIARFGTRGLYTSTLFRLQSKFYDEICPALELGRSFVRPEYQKGYLPLLLLWKGLGHYVARNPRYRTLFGPVSISKDYNPSSRALIVSFLKSRHCDEVLAERVKPRKKFRVRGPRDCEPRNFSSLLSNLDELSEVVADLEADGKGIPILLQQYLNLGGQILDFSVDRKFSNVLDGLIVVDLLKPTHRQLERYMGKANAAEFLQFHGVPAK